MKVIVLMPTKNEEWIIDSTLKTLSAFADHIIIADQHSTDRTRKICANYPKVRVVDNHETCHSNKVRWLLLDEARKMPGENLILCVDADEMISKSSIQKVLEKAAEAGPGTAFSFPWIQLWKNTSQHRIDGAWNRNFKIAGFYDGRTTDYQRTFVINDHTNRVPLNQEAGIIAMEAPLLHFQFAAWNRTRIKQAWYRCSELIATPGAERRINQKYSPSDDSETVKTESVPSSWTEGIFLPEQEVLQDTDDARKKEILGWFDKYGILFFEGLQIWHVDELERLFVSRIGRPPKPKTFPRMLVKLNALKNFIISRIKA